MAEHSFQEHLFFFTLTLYTWPCNAALARRYSTSAAIHNLEFRISKDEFRVVAISPMVHAVIVQVGMESSFGHATENPSCALTLKIWGPHHFIYLSDQTGVSI